MVNLRCLICLERSREFFVELASTISAVILWSKNYELITERLHDFRLCKSQVLLQFLNDIHVRLNGAVTHTEIKSSSGKCYTRARARSAAAACGDA